MHSGFGSNNSFVPTVLAIVAIVIGGVALFFGMSAHKLEMQMNGMADDLNQRMADVAQQTDSMQAGLQSLERQTRQSFIAVAGEIKSMQAGPKSASVPAAAAAGSPATAADAGVYKIKAGDTLDRVAKAHGLPTEALLKANSGVDPRRLKVDQKIKIPAAAQ